MVDSVIRPPEGYESAFKSKSSRSVSSTTSVRSGFAQYGIGIDGKEPYQIVIEKNLRSLRKRAQDNTREELTSVLQRVENTLVEYEKSVFTTDNFKKKIEEVDEEEAEHNDEDDDPENELEKVVSDKIDSFRYKQKIIVFIMGQQESVKKKNILLSELNSFFIDQRANFDPSQINITEIDFDFDEVKVDIDQCLGSAKIMLARLDELNENIVQYLINNSGNKQAKVLIERSKKKLEKSLLDTKQELNDLTTKLETAQNELNERDEKIETLVAQLELKREFMKKSDSSSRKDIELHLLKTKLRKQEMDIRALKRKLTKAEIEHEDLTSEIEEIKTEDNVSKMWKKDPNNPINIAKAQEAAEAAAAAGALVGEDGRPKTVDGANLVPAAPQNTIAADGGVFEPGQQGGDATQHLDKNVSSVVDDFEIQEDEIMQFKSAQENEQMKKDFEKKIEALNAKLKMAEMELEKYKKARATQATATSRAEKAKKNAKKGGKKESATKEKEEEEIVEELPLEPVVTENVKQFEMLDAMENGGPIEDIDLTTEDWINVQPMDMPKRYEALRRYANAKIGNLKNDLGKIVDVDREKIDKLKRQYLEHKKLWETERLVLLNTKDMEFEWDQERENLMNKAEIAYGLQQEAQNLAEEAIHELEDFICDDARLDRETAESALQILRERSRTLSQLSAKADQNMTDDAKIHETSEPFKRRDSNIESNFKVTRTGSRAHTHVQIERQKIPIILDMLKYNASIKFPNIKVLEDLIENVNSDHSNKFTLIINQIISRPTTSYNLKGQITPSRAHSAIRNLPPIDRKSARSYSNSNNFGGDEDILNQSFNDDVFAKAGNDDENLINEMRNTVISRNSLRSAHLKKLEETKAHLNEIKNKVADAFVNSKSDLEIPTGDEPRTELIRVKTTEKREEFLSRMNSAKSINHLTGRANSNMLSHPIVLEYIKTYDIVSNFKNIITKSIPNKSNSLFAKFSDKMNRVNMMEFNNESKVTPQIVKMTTNIDQTLNEIQVVFSEMIDELVASKFDIIDKEQKLDKIKSRPQTGVEREITSVRKTSSKKSSESSRKASPGLPRPGSGAEEAITISSKPKSRPTSPTSVTVKEEPKLEKSLSKQREVTNENIAVEKEKPSSEKIRSLEKELKEKTGIIIQLQGLLKKNEEQKVEKTDEKKDEKKEKTTVDKAVEASEHHKESSDLYLLSQKQYPVVDELSALKENYNDLEKQYIYETDMYQKKINNLNGDIEQLTEAVQILKRELDQHRSAQFGMSRSNTCTPTVGVKPRSPILPAINPSDFKNEMKSDLSKKESPVNTADKFNNPPCIMFTRLDADRNKKRLKRAQGRGIVTDKIYEHAVNLMEKYISIPSTRFMELVQKYIDFKQRKVILDNLSNIEKEDEKIDLSGIEKMQNVHQKKDTSYNNRVNNLHRNRISLAYDLTEALDDIERQSGIFLIKPFYSYQGKNPKDEFMRINKIQKKEKSNKTPDNRTDPDLILKYYRSGSSRNSEHMATWNVEDSFVRDENSSEFKRTTLVKSPTQSNPTNLLNTPKMLELDVNRMIISQNQAATESKTPLRSYLAIDRSTGAANVDGSQSNTIRNMLFDARSISGLSNMLMIEDKKSQSPLPPIKPKEHVNQDANDIMDIGSVGTPSSPSALSRANTTDLNK